MVRTYNHTAESNPVGVVVYRDWVAADGLIVQGTEEVLTSLAMKV